MTVDVEAIVSAYHAYVTDPRASRSQHHWDTLITGPVAVALLDTMVLEGVTERDDVAALVRACTEGRPVVRYVPVPMPHPEWIAR